MKYRFYLAILILLFGSPIIAQNNRVNFGLKAGANYSKYEKSGGSAFKRKPGFYVGGFSEIKINEDLNFHPELLFSLQGSSIKIKDIEVRESFEQPPKIGDFKSNINDYAIVMPLMARYDATKTFFLEGGPQPGFIFKTEEKLIKSPTSDPEFTQLQEHKNKTFDLGLAIGLGFKLSDEFIIDARYYNSIIKRDIYNIKSSIFNLGIEYQL